MTKFIVNKKIIFFTGSAMLVIFLILISWKLNSEKQVAENIKIRAAGGTYRKNVALKIIISTPSVVPTIVEPTIIQQIILPTFEAPTPSLTPEASSPTSIPRSISELPQSADYILPSVAFIASLFLIVVSLIF